MISKNISQQHPLLDLTAAQIGVNKWNWVTTDSEDDGKAKKIMIENSYDVLPVKNCDGTINKFFATREWNKYDCLNLENINESNSIYYRISIKDLVRKFHENNRHFYLLTNYKETIGIVSFVNLNCHAMYSYLFHVISDIEQKLSLVLKDYVNEKSVLDFYNSSDDKHLNMVHDNYNISLSTGSNNTIFDHMYLQTIGITINKFINDIPDNYKSINKYRKKFSPNGVYNNVRNKVMHPVRPILNSRDGISEINELLNDYYEILEILHNN